MFPQQIQATSSTSTSSIAHPGATALSGALFTPSGFPPSSHYSQDVVFPMSTHGHEDHLKAMSNTSTGSHEISTANSVTHFGATPSDVLSLSTTPVSDSAAGVPSSTSHDSSDDVSSTHRKRPRPNSPNPGVSDANDRRRRNNIAAAKYRQKKVDRIAELEAALAEVSQERDDLKLRLVKQDAEIEVLRRLSGDGKT